MENNPLVINTLTNYKFTVTVNPDKELHSNSKNDGEEVKKSINPDPDKKKKKKNRTIMLKVMVRN